MTNRPWPLVILALIQMMTPIVNVLFNSWTLGVKPNYVMGWIMERPTLEIFEFFFLMPIAGIAILRMRKWSYVVFFAAMGWSLISNLRYLQYTSQSHSMLALLVVYSLQILLVLYFLLPSVRVTYFNPRVRWWESKPRFELKIPCTLEVKSQRHEGTILNVSEGGVFFQIPKGFNVGDVSRLEFHILSQIFSASGKIVHQRELGNGVYCYGIQFDHTSDSQKRFQNLTEALELLEFQQRTPGVPLLKSFTNWIATLLKTGKGFTPQIKK